MYKTTFKPEIIIKNIFKDSFSKDDAQIDYYLKEERKKATLYKDLLSNDKQRL